MAPIFVSIKWGELDFCLIHLDYSLEPFFTLIKTSNRWKSLPWRGKLSFLINIPCKRHQFGLKIFVFCDCKTGFFVYIMLYTGGDTEYYFHSFISFHTPIQGVVHLSPSLFIGIPHSLFTNEECQIWLIFTDKHF